MTFRVIDNKTGKEPDLEDIALNEKWAFDLIHCDMQGFAITDEGDLIMLDECGDYEFCPQGRFTVVMDSEEHKAGKWIFGSTLGHSWMKCSECCVSQDGQTACFTYCPNCGAKMEGADNE